MCGIVGFVNDKDNKKTIINTMMDRIVHRGPNSSGEYIDKHVALGFRRLSIIDLEAVLSLFTMKIGQRSLFLMAKSIITSL